jgi:hypothetical protein
MATDTEGRGRIVCPRCGQRLRIEDGTPKYEPGTEPLPRPEERSPADPRPARGE